MKQIYLFSLLLLLNITLVYSNLELKEAAESGNPEAIFQLGEAYELGREDIERNVTAAFIQYNTSVAQGHAGAQRNLGFLLLLKEFGYPKTRPLSLLHFTFAAEGKDLMASQVLGYKYFSGNGVPKACEKAAYHYKFLAGKIVEEVKRTGIQTIHEATKLPDAYDATRDKSSDEEDVVNFYRYSANSGDVNALNTMATFYLQGSYGLTQDFDKAFSFFSKAAELNDMNAISHLGFMYAKGYGVKQDNATALKYFRKAADQENLHAMNHLGYMYLYGHGVDQNFKTAYEYLRRSADKGYPEAQLHVGTMHFHGWGVKADQTLGFQYFQLAAHQGNLIAVYNLANMQLAGLATKASCSSAVTLLKKLVEKGPMAKYFQEAQKLFNQGDGEGALLIYSKLAEMGFETAQINAAWLLEKNFVQPPPIDRLERSLRYFMAAADQGNADAQLKVGDLYYYGRGVGANYEKAAGYYTLAYEGNNAQATFNLGYMHEHGLGLPSDLFLAKRYYDQTAELSSEAYLAVILALNKLLVHFIFDKLKVTSVSLLTGEGFGDLGLGLGVDLGYDIHNSLLVVLSTALIIALGWRTGHLRFLQNNLHPNPPNQVNQN